MINIQNKQKKEYWIAFLIGIVGIFLLGWVSGAVGIIGSENNPANLMYWSVFVVRSIGTVISKLRPNGMKWTLYITAFIQMSIPIFALFIRPAKTSWGAPGVNGVLILNFIFVAIFTTSGILFERVNGTGKQQKNQK